MFPTRRHWQHNWSYLWDKESHQNIHHPTLPNWHPSHLFFQNPCVQCNIITTFSLIINLASTHNRPLYPWTGRNLLSTCPTSVTIWIQLYPLTPSPPNSLLYPIPLPSIFLIITHHPDTTFLKICPKHIAIMRIVKRCIHKFIQMKGLERLHKNSLHSNANSFMPKKAFLWGNKILRLRSPLHEQRFSH